MNSKKNVILKSALSALLMIAIIVGALFIMNKQPADYDNGGAVVRISLDEFIGWKQLLYANGGLTTKEGSINAENGIMVEYVIMNDANASSNALINGELQGAGYTVNRYAFLQSKFDAAGLRVIMPYITNYSNGGDGIIATADIRSVEDLVGKKIAVPRFSEAQTLVEWLITNSSLSKSEISGIRNNIVYFETADETAKAFFAGTVDAAATWEPYLTQAASSTDSRILFDTRMGTNLILDGLVFSKDFVEQNEEFIVKLIDGAFEANAMYMREFDSIKVMPMFELMTDSEIAEMCNGASLATWADNSNLLPKMAVEMYRQMAEIWKSLGESANPGQAESAFTDKYIKQLAGKYPTDDVTSFNFSKEGRQDAENLSNNAALLSVTLNIEFEADSYRVARSSYGDLNEFAKVAETLNGVYIQIEGNTAHIAGGDNGIDFSYKRALSVAKYLQALGLEPDRFIIVGNGDTKPIADNETEEGRAANRRTEVYFKVIGY